MIQRTVPAALLSAFEADTATEGMVSARALITLRWIIVLGQIALLLYGHYFLQVNMPFGACIGISFAALVFNIAAVAHRRRTPRLQSHQAALYSAFDILQIALLIYLTGGLDNPFAIFLITPIAMAASLLRFWMVAALTALTLLCIFLNAVWHLPLPWPYGSIELPRLYSWVVAAALSLSALFIATYAWNAARTARQMRRALNATQSDLAAANQMTAMGALAAAVAHELGTPLATISLVSKEILRETKPGSELREDVELLVSQADRCRQVLADFARKPAAEGGDPYSVLPLLVLIEEVAAKHRPIGLNLELLGDDALTVLRSPELVHGLGNFMQNAFQYAKVGVKVNVQRLNDRIIVQIEDDGPGYAPSQLQKLGEPYISTRESAGHGHMGLGIFIAKTLLERTGALVTFCNRKEGGARVTVTWKPSAAIFSPVTA